MKDLSKYFLYAAVIAAIGFVIQLLAISVGYEATYNPLYNVFAAGLFSLLSLYFNKQ